MVLGKVYLVGAGPGDPNLLTLKAFDLLKNAQVIIYDRLVGSLIIELFPINSEKIYVGKRTGKHTVAQEEISDLLVDFALKGKNVVRLKGGDPFVFGRGGEEAEKLVENNIPFEVVPGVTSAIAAPTYAGIPLTHRKFASSVCFVTGHAADCSERAINWKNLANTVDTIVILMGIESLDFIVNQLLEGGINPTDPVAIIERGTLKEQRVILGEINSILEIAKENKITPPAVIVVGEVVKLGNKLSWMSKNEFER